MTSNKIYTIGYEGMKPADFISALKEAGIETLLDIRAVPFSRKPGFSKNPLAEMLAKSGIKYVGLKGLGNPVRKSTDYKDAFSKHLETAAAKKDLAEASRIAKETKACLLCFENDPLSCHRLLVAEKMHETEGWEIGHLAQPLMLL